MALLLLVSPAPVSALDWPQFRGPHGDGAAPGAHPPIVWSESTNVAWKVLVTGRGRSSPVVLGDRIWLTTAVEQGVVRQRIGPDDMQTAEQVSLRAVCLDRHTGKSLWETTLFDVPNPDPVHWLNSWATPTPVVEPGRVYCDFGTFGTACLDAATGKVLWKQQLRLDHQVGPGSSPVLYLDCLVLVRDGRDAQYVAALDKNTGRTLWKTARPPIQTSSPNLKKSFSTPLAIEHDGQVQLVAPGAHWTVAYDPLTGKEVWRVRHGDGFSFGTRPVFGHGLVFFGTGCFKAQLWAVRPDGHDDVTASHVAWKTLRQVPVMSSPILVDDELYWVSDDGMVTCADAHSGQIHWQERLGGSFLASPLSAEGRLYCFRQDAKTLVLKAGKLFELLAENSLEGTVAATPAIGDHALYLRTDSHLYCLRNGSAPLSPKSEHIQKQQRPNASSVPVEKARPSLDDSCAKLSDGPHQYLACEAQTVAALFPAPWPDRMRCQPPSPPATALQNAGALTSTPGLSARFWTAAGGGVRAHTALDGPGSEQSASPQEK